MQLASRLSVFPIPNTGCDHLTSLPVLIRKQMILPSASQQSFGGQQQKQEGSFLQKQMNLLLCLVTVEHFSFHFALSVSSVSAIMDP
jgi:hypothetical protein